MSDVRSTEQRLADLDLLTDEERARRQANWRRNFPGAGDRPLTLAEIVAKPDEEWVKCTIPTGFTIRAQNGVQVPFPVGEYDVPKSLAEHWYFRANGGVIGDAPKREEKPEYEPPASGLSAQPWDAGNEQRSEQQRRMHPDRNLPHQAPRADEEYVDRPDHPGPRSDQRQDERHPGPRGQQETGERGRDAHADARRDVNEPRRQRPDQPPTDLPPGERPPGERPHPEPQKTESSDTAKRDPHQDERKQPETAPHQPVQPAAPVPPPMSSGQPTISAQPVQQPQPQPTGQARQGAQPQPAPRTGPPEPRQTEEKKG